MKELVVGENGIGKRIDNYLYKLYGEKIGRSELYRYIRKKRIKVNGKRTNENYRLCLGDIIFLYINDDLLDSTISEVRQPKIKNPKIDVVYEDENIIIVDKPAGLIVHPDKTQKFDTLIDHLKAYFVYKNQDIVDKDGFSVAFCNRIDRNTSGLVIAAKNNATLLAMNRLIKNREITKKYKCLVYGNLNIGTNNIIKGYITKNTVNNTVIVTDESIENSKYAETRYSVLKTGYLNLKNSSQKINVSLLEVELITGRTHQIRAHLSYIGYPIVGDSKYGSKKLNRLTGYKYQILHSYSIEFHESLSEPHLKYLSKKVITGTNIIDYVA